MSDRIDEKDDFWDVSKLLPKKRSILSPFASKNVVTEVTAPAVEATEPKYTGAERQITEKPSTMQMEEADSYTPERGGLIKQVTVKRRVDKYDFYESFRKAALLYYDYYTDKCDFAEFYSYMPQYSQLKDAQRSYYFYWRYMLRHGKYIRTDYSYIYLYVYEILNLPDKIPPEEGIRLLCSLWREYRKSLPRLDNYFSIWVQDYCLVHRLPCPEKELGEFLPKCIASADFREFYLSDIKNAGEGGVLAMLAFLSDYDWTRGKFVSGKPREDERGFNIAVSSSEDYKKHMIGAMRRVLSSLDLCPQGASTATLKRDAFPNSLCTHSVKCRLEVEYYPVSGESRLRATVTEAVRYTENKLRALMGVKSRLGIKSLDDGVKAIIDGYFSSLFDSERAVYMEINAPEYERLYDAPREQMSIEDADVIERASWGTTARLVEGVEDGEEDTEPELGESLLCAEKNTEVGTEDSYGLSREAIAMLKGLIENDCTAATAAAEELYEQINEAFADNFGDVVLENDGDSITLIEDYREDITQWLEKITK